MLGSLATMAVFCWHTNARLVRKLYGWIYLSFYVIKIYHWVQMIIDLAEFKSKELFFVM